MSKKGESSSSSDDGSSASSVTLICLCATACCLSMPLNGLAPSLSIAAQDLGFDAHERDLYLVQVILTFACSP